MQRKAAAGRAGVKLVPYPGDHPGRQTVEARVRRPNSRSNNEFILCKFWWRILQLCHDLNIIQHHMEARAQKFKAIAL